MAKRTYNRRKKTTAKKPVTSDKGRKQRVKGAETERRTGSKDRMTRGRGVSRTATGAPRGAQGPANPPQQGPMRKISGLLGKRKLKPTGGPAVAQMVGLEIAGKMAQTAGKPGQSRMSKLGIQGPAKPVAKSKPKKKMASMGSDYKAKEKEASRKAVASNFDQAFAKARKAGKKTFVWRGKRYNTRLK